MSYSQNGHRGNSVGSCKVKGSGQECKNAMKLELNTNVLRHSLCTLPTFLGLILCITQGSLIHFHAHPQKVSSDRVCGPWTLWMARQLPISQQLTVSGDLTSLLKYFWYETKGVQFSQLWYKFSGFMSESSWEILTNMQLGLPRRTAGSDFPRGGNEQSV